MARRAQTAERAKTTLPAQGSAQVGIAACGGLIFSALFYLRYAEIPPEFYLLRDDGLITLSHARNLIDFGFIGVSPSGERVEGFSTPLQFLAYALLYGLTGVEYETYAIIQTLACTFALGALFASIFIERPIAALILTAAAALFLSYSTSFVEWHGSGMENALTHVFYLATIVLLVRFTQSRMITHGFAWVVLLASIARVESIYHVAPLLLIFSVYWRMAHNSWEGYRFFAIVLIGWILINVTRFLYFGEMLPNTALAQAISLPDRVNGLLTGEAGMLRQSAFLAGTILDAHGGYLLFATCPLLLFIKRNRVVILCFALLASVALTCCLNPFLFGPTRLDATRSTSFLAVIVAVWIAALAFNVDWKKNFVWVPLLPAAVGTAMWALTSTAPYELCCPSAVFKEIGATFAAAASGERLPRPTVANPDLGAVSWPKQFNIVDFGRIGSPVLTRLSTPEALATYFFDIAAPDLIEHHFSYFSCRDRRALFLNPRFDTRYQAIEEPRQTEHSCGLMPSGIWIRKEILAGATSRERMLIDRLQEALVAPIPTADEWRSPAGAPVERSRPVEGESRNIGAAVALLIEELEHCRNQGTAACIYVARTAYRFLPEFRKAGAIDQLQKAFDSSPTREYDLAWLNGYRDPQAGITMAHLLNSGQIRFPTATLPAETRQ